MGIKINTPNHLSMITEKGIGVKPQWTRDQLMEAFKRYDKNGDGKLSKEELKQAFKYLGSAWGGFRAGRAMSYADSDNSGFVEISDKEMEDLVNYAFECGYKLR